MTISAAQIRAANGLLGINVTQLAAETGLNLNNLNQFLSPNISKDNLSKKTLDIIEEFFTENMVVFTENEGVQKKDSIAKIYKGKDGFRRFMDDVADTVEKHGGTICVSGVDERQWEKWGGKHLYTYMERMTEIKKSVDFEFRILISEHDDHEVAGGYATYKKSKEMFFSRTPLYIYGNKKADILFKENSVIVWVIEDAALADGRRNEFNLQWKNTSDEI